MPDPFLNGGKSRSGYQLAFNDPTPLEGHRPMVSAMARKGMSRHKAGSFRKLAATVEFNKR